ncbi:MAG: MASE3 domain-containing protein [Acidobacteriota bacterium]
MYKSLSLFNRRSLIPGVLIVAGLYLASAYNYLIFHSLIEIFCVVISWSIFMVAWNSRHLVRNNYLLFLGISQLFAGSLALLHMLSYRGMDVFNQGYGSNLPTQFWIASRYVESFSLFLAPLFIGRKVKDTTLFTAFAATTALFLASIFYWRIFPDCYVDGHGLTPFKRVSEYVISLVFFASIFSLLPKKKDFDPRVFHLLILSILVSILAEMAFTFYVGVYDYLNLTGHFLRFIASFLLYKAFIETGMVMPYDLLFRDLARSEKNLYALLEELPALVYLQSPDFSIRYSNRRFRDCFGDPEGVACYDILQGRDEPCEDCSTFKVIETGIPQRKEWILLDGRTYQIYEYPFADVDEAMQVLKLGIDITDRKRAETELRDARDKLDLRVRERTEELTRMNETLRSEIAERRRVQEALQESEKELRQLSAKLMTAQEEERKNIAMELHDSIGGSLSAIKFAAQNAVAQWERNEPQKGVESLKSLQSIVQSTIDEVRRIHTGIWPSILEDLGVIMAMDWFCRRYTETYPHIAVEKEINLDEDEIADRMKIVIYRIMQESLNNIAKHGKAERVSLSLRKHTDRIELLIVDDGVGFDLEEAFHRSNSRRGLGLSSMRERARLSGGRYEIESAIGKGTTVRVVWPLDTTE